MYDSRKEIRKSIDFLNSCSPDKLLFHRNRFQTVLKRVKLITELVLDDNSAIDTEVNSQAISLLCITLEEIVEYATLFSSKTRELAAHIIKHGSDEEQFIKWNERIQHVLFALKPTFTEKFDDSLALEEFQKDIVHLQSEIIDMVVLLHGSDNQRLKEAMKGLLGHQTSVRSTYQTKTAPNASLEINPKKIKYDKIIGHGGIRLLM